MIRYLNIFLLFKINLFMQLLIINSAKEWGGNELWSVSAANSLADTGVKVYFAARTDIFNGKLSDSVQIVKVPLKHEVDLATYKTLNSIINSAGINIILSTKRKDYVIGGVLGKIHSLPVVFRLGIQRKISKKDFPQRLVYKILPSAVITNAEITKRDLISDSLVRADIIHTIYNGYKFGAVSPIIDFAIPHNDDFIFCAAGRLAPQKGFDVLLEACSILKQKELNFQLYIAGEGSERQTYTDFIDRKGLKNNVFLPGHLNNVRAFFAQGNCVVIPSRSEGVPNALFEAWSMMKPVICSNASGLPEVIKNGENGLMVNLSADEIAEKMEKVMSDKKLCGALGRNGNTTLIHDFSLEKMTNKILKLFSDLIDEKHK